MSATQTSGAASTGRHGTEPTGGGALRAAFNKVYAERVLAERFVEEPKYYTIYSGRYLRTLEHYARLGLGADARMLEIGGGQIALLANGIWGHRATVCDLSTEFAAPITKHGIEFRTLDLLRDDLPERGVFDAIVLCEVVEHLPVPLHGVLGKVMSWLKPGGAMLVTTPNLFRLRNLYRMALGKSIFCPLFIPDPGHGIGHPFEFDAWNLRWQMEHAGLERVGVSLDHYPSNGFSTLKQVRQAAVGMLTTVRPVLREALIATGRRPATAKEKGA